jgi:hypothetical protein
MALPKHKTCLSILRSILGPGAGGEARFAKKIGRSTSWLKKASCAQITITKDTAVRIAYETGVSAKWLMADDPAKPALDQHGKKYSAKTYAAHRDILQNGIDAEDAEASYLEIAGQLENIVSLYSRAVQSNRGGLFTYQLGEVIASLSGEYNRLKVKNSEAFLKTGRSVTASLDALWNAEYPADEEWDSLHSTSIQQIQKQDGKTSNPTPQKKQPSRHRAKKA